MFLFVDQILALEPGQRAVGVHHVVPAGAYLRRGADGQATMLSCVIGEALGQLGAWSVMAANDFTRRPVAGIVGGVRIQGEARPGDTLRLDTTIDSVSEQAVAYHAVASVDGREVLRLENAVGPFLPMEDFSDPAEVRRQFEIIHRPGSADGVRWPERWPAVPGNDGPAGFGFDAVERRAADEWVATKRVTPDHAFFVDHFPRKPVVPLSLLLEALLEQADALVAGAGSPTLRASRVRGIKMRRFLEPGSTLEATLRVRERSADAAEVTLRCDIDGQRACAAVAEFSASLVTEPA